LIAQGSPELVGPLFAFAGGGTGGHLYPAIGVAAAIRERLPDARFVFFGTQRAIDKQILDTVDCGLVRQTLSPLSAKPWRWPAMVRDLHTSHRVCRDFFEGDFPAVVVGTGGLASVAPVREAHRAGIPVAIFNPDAIPGRANRHLAARASLVFAQWPETIRHYPRSVRAEVTGCPVRPSFHTASRRAGVEHFGLDPARKMLLVTGASQGARTINEAALACADFIAELGDWQILHLTGKNDHEFVARGYAGRRNLAKVVAYTENMADALAAADLVISRAGASTLAELTALGRASVLLPYPFHRDQHQWANALCLSETGAARIVRDSIDVNITAPALKLALAELMASGDARGHMSAAAATLGRLDAAEVIAEKLLELAGRRDASCHLETVEAICTASR
jgi:UDP-N-acetylglucosamine--N-acetylmuramyl-(pentapeptide) pyrophosphoryl-undecaprenol N-acetylglucosamine transferase